MWAPDLLQTSPSQHYKTVSTYLGVCTLYVGNDDLWARTVLTESRSIVYAVESSYVSTLNLSKTFVLAVALKVHI